MGQVKLALLHLKDTIANIMANEKNLKPQNTRTKSEQRKIAQKGGIASGKARLAKKTAREYAIAALEATTKDNEGKLITLKDVMIQKVIAKAIKEGDLNAVKYIVELIGESPSQKIEVTGKDGKDLVSSKTDAELEQEIAELRRKLGE